MLLRKGTGSALCGFVLLLSTWLTGASARGASAPSLRVRQGTLTINGLTVKSNLNLSLTHWHYLYVYLPGQGTAIIGERPFAGADEQQGAFHGNALTVNAGRSRVQLTSAAKLRGSRSAYVRFEAGAGPGGRSPAMSFGDAASLPAIWPGTEQRRTKNGPRMVQVHAGRTPRTGRLCRPPRHGREQCAIVREVVYQPE